MADGERVDSGGITLTGAEAALARVALLDRSRALDRNSGRRFGEPRDPADESEVNRRLAARIGTSLLSEHWAMQPADAAKEVYRQEVETEEAPKVD